MNSNKKTTRILEDVNVNVKIKLAALWTAIMFCYTYADILAHMRKDILEEFLAGEAGGVPITQEVLLGAAVLQVIPTVMIFLSLTLKAKANRWTNTVLGIVYAVVALATMLMGETWAYYYIFAIAEVVLLALIVWFAWKWPKQEG